MNFQINHRVSVNVTSVAIRAIFRIPMDIALGIVDYRPSDILKYLYQNLIVEVIEGIRVDRIRVICVNA